MFAMDSLILYLQTKIWLIILVYFFPYYFETNANIIVVILKMDEAISNMSDQTKSRLNKINKIKDYYNSKIEERKAMSKKISKCIVAFDYIDKSLIVLSAISWGVSIVSFTTVIGVPAGIASTRFSLVFPLITGIIKALLRITRNQKMKHRKIVMLAKSKLAFKL